MVLKGQFLERPTLIPVGTEVLEGVSHRGELSPPLLIVPPPPEQGGSMDHVVAAELAYAAASSGRPTLRFNFRGVGASQGRIGGPPERVADAEAALRVLEENTGAARVGVVAIDGSANTIFDLAQRHPSVAGIAFVSPRDLDLARVARVSMPMLVIMGARDMRIPRAAVSAAVTEAGGWVEVIAEGDQTYNRHLPQVGKAVVAWLATL